MRGTSPLVSRDLAAFTAAMRVCDPALEGHADSRRGHAEAIARRLGWSDERLESCASARRSTTSARSTFATAARETRSARRGRARRDQGASGRRCVADRRRALPRDGTPIRALPPRALGRRRLPDAARRHRDPDRGASARSRGRIRRDDLDGRIATRSDRGLGSGRGRAVRRDAVRPATSRRPSVPPSTAAGHRPAGGVSEAAVDARAGAAAPA